MAGGSVADERTLAFRGVTGAWSTASPFATLGETQLATGRSERNHSLDDASESCSAPISSLASLSGMEYYKITHGRGPRFESGRERVSTALRPGYSQFTNLAYARSGTEPSHSTTVVAELRAALVSSGVSTSFPCYGIFGYTPHSIPPVPYGRSNRVVR